MFGFQKPTTRLASQFLRYILVGGACFVADLGILLFCTRVLGIPYLTSGAFGFAAGLVLNYILSVRYVFRSRKLADRRIEFFLFAAVGLTGLLWNEAILWVSVESAALGVATAKAVAASLVLVWNFTVRKLLLF